MPIRASRKYKKQPDGDWTLKFWVEDQNGTVIGAYHEKKGFISEEAVIREARRRLFGSYNIPGRHRRYAIISPENEEKAILPEQLRRA